MHDDKMESESDSEGDEMGLWVYVLYYPLRESKKKTQNLRKLIKYNLYLDLTIHVSDLEMEVDTVEEPAAA